MTDYLTNPATLGMGGSMGTTAVSGMGGTSGFGGSDESPRVSYTLRVNGLERPVNEAWIGESLLYVLRERLGLAGAKGGCDQGECGACSVQLDGQLTAACLVPAALAADSEIRTVEGLTSDGGPSDVQRALAESGAVQCGYCVPGLAMAVHDLLERNHRPTDLQAREALCGNLCRCTGYSGALAAVQAVARSREAAGAADSADAVGTAGTADEDVVGTAGVAGATGAATEGREAGGPAVGGPGAPGQPVYVGLPAQQSAEPQAPQYAAYPQPQVEQQQHYQQRDTEYATGQYPVQEHATGQFAVPEYSTGQFPVQEHATGQYPVQEHATGQFAVPEYSTGQYPVQEHATGQFAVPDYATGQYPVQEYPAGGYPQDDYPQQAEYPQQTEYPQQAEYPQAGAVPAAEAEPGVYVLPHQQQHTHAPAPEA